MALRASNEKSNRQLPDFPEDDNSYRFLNYLMGQSSRIAAWMWNLETGTFLISDTFHDIFAADGNENASAINITQLLRPHLSVQNLIEFKDDLLALRDGKKSHTLTEWYAGTQQDKTLCAFHSYAVRKNEKTVKLCGTVEPKGDGKPVDLLTAVARRLPDKIEFSVLVLDENFRVLDFNKNAAQSLRYSAAELKDGIELGQLDIESGKNTRLQYAKSARRGETVKYITSFQRKDSTVFPVEVTLFYHNHEDRDMYCLTAQDVSRQRLEESDLRPSLAQQQVLTRRLQQERKYFRDSAAQSHRLSNIVTVSNNYKNILKQIEQVAVTDTTVLITGETGTGKELLAQAVHDMSPRKAHPLIKVNCAVLPADLIESELFGHEKGAFTGAHDQKIGRFELANKGSILLDEIGEMPVLLQSRLLRILQEGEFQRVGGTKTIETDVRVIAATNRDLEKMTEEGTFREDLYYRLCVFPIHNIPLRERAEDIEVLAYHFLRKFAKKMGRPVQKISAKDLKRLKSYDFPGNIRELENIVERSVILSKGETLNLDFWNPTKSAKAVGGGKFLTLEEIQIKHIKEALDKTKNKVSGPGGAASLLDINEQTLFSRMRKFGIERG